MLEDISRSVFLPESILSEPSANYPCEMITSHFMLARSNVNKEFPASFHEEFAEKQSDCLQALIFPHQAIHIPP